MRRLKSEVLPQLPAKRQVVVPVALDNEREYRLAENDVIAWLREQPLDLRELNAKIAATLRAERLAQLGTLQRLAARGKLHAALAWIHDFLASGEPLVVFARHIEVQEAVHGALPGRPAPARARQDPGPRRVRPRLPGPRRPAAHRVRHARRRPGDHAHARLERRLPRARVDAGDARPGRGPLHRIGQRDAVTAWYLLAADTIDETMARLIHRKRGLIAAVTDGRTSTSDGMVDGVVRELRGGKPFRHLRSVV